MGKGRALGTVAMVLALAPPASAATLTVDPATADGCNGSPATCRTIGQAANAANADDTILIKPGTYSESPNFVDANLVVRNAGGGQVRITGGVLFAFSGSGGATVQGLIVAPTAANTPAVRIESGNVDGAKTLTIESSILSGNGTGAAVRASSGVGAGAISITVRHSTISDAATPSAPATSFAAGSGAGAISATIANSIVHGTTTATVTNSDTDESTAHKDALFVDRAQENFTLRVGSPAIDQGGALEVGEWNSDVDGETRPSGGANDRGGDELVNHPPAAPGLVADRISAAPGEQITFGAFAGPQPDADRGDGVAKYRFDFGDGSAVVEQTSFAAVHAYAAPGQYTVTAKTVDIPGAESVPSNAATITIAAGGSGGPAGPDVAAPTLSITSPRLGQRLKRGRRAPVLRGRTRDATGVRAVELALRRFDGRRCRWYDGRRAFLLGSCTRPRFFRAVIDDFAWSYTFPRRIVPGVGRYELRARATDFLGNRTTAFSASSRTLAGFRIVR